MATKSEIVRGMIPLVFGLVVIIVVVIVIPNAVQYIGKASGEPANLRVNAVGILGKTPMPWRNLAQGGEEPKEMLAGVVPQVKALRPEYIRLDHIYDAFKVVDKKDGQLAYNWTGLDEAVKVILATGAKPFLSLSYMPEGIGTGDMISAARDWNEWGSVVQATIEHYSGRDGMNLDGVIYEVWNEPDLFGSFKTYGEKNYLDMYAASARAAARTRNVNRFEFGGPATTALYQNWVERLIKFADANNYRLDFVSWHKYTYDVDQFEKDAKQARAWAEKIPAFVNMKYYVTEWGQNSENDKTYDTKMGAIHTIAGSRAMMGTIDRAFVFEIKDGPGNEKYWSRWGMMTHEKFGTPEKKPRYHAIDFLNGLANTRLSLTGEGSWVRGVATMDDSGNIKLLVFNYDERSQRTESVPVLFENLPSGNFKYTRRDFMGGTKSQQVATSEASWRTTEMFGPNSAAMITLEF